ncbi:MAG TPA: alpha/beta hydrolase [Ohtaekwangia sp.]|nr:alpha/beta hydrolase [Ohtaekwangia sp.]
MKTNVLFIQGAGNGAYEEDKKLAESLRNSLNAGFEVHYPAMKDEADADYHTWAAQIREESALLDGPLIFVGHSVGASVLIKFFSETETPKTIRGIFLMAAPFWGGEGGWTYEGYETLALPDESACKLSKDVPVFFYHSRDDETVPFAHLALYAKRLPNATIHAREGGGHQLNNDLSGVADDIKRLFSAP